MADLSQIRVSGTLYNIKDAVARMAMGAPGVAATVSAMTDQGKVYVYTGSESGYTNGNWYYYNGSSWVSGGVYNSAVVETDTSLSVSGAPADAKVTGDSIKYILEVGDTASSNYTQILVSDTTTELDLVTSEELNEEISDLRSAVSSGAGFNASVKAALYALVSHIGRWTDGNAQTYIQNLYDAMYPPTNLSYISAVYTQSGVVEPSDSLDSLKADLVVTAHYDDMTTGTVTNYVLSGVLAAGTSTITVTYGGKTTTFTVTVTASHNLPSAYQEVEWIGNSANSLGIFTEDFQLPSAFRLEAKTQLQGWNTNGTYGNIAAVFQPGVTTYGYELAYIKDSDAITSFLGAQSNVTPSNINAEIICGTICDGTDEQAYIVVNGERVYGTSVSVSRNYYDNYLGIFHGGNTVKNQLVGKLWYLNIYNGSDELIANFVPCYRKSDSQIGLYETVSEKFYFRATSDSGIFTKGEDVE